jgi:hypothetical protein
MEHMDGERALEYARIRHSDNDYKRIERQQLVLRAIIAKGKTLNFIDVGKMRDLYGAYHDSIDTDIPDTSIPGLGLLAKQIDEKGGLANMKMVSMAPATFPCTVLYSNCDCACLEWNVRKMEELKAQVFSDVQLQTESAVISILNGTDEPQFATQFKGELTISGIPAYNVTADDWANGLLYPTTVIVNVTGANQHTVEQIQDWLGVPDSRLLTATDPQAAQFLPAPGDAYQPDIIVVLGTDSAPTATTYYEPPPEEDPYVPPEETDPYIPPESEEATETPPPEDVTETPETEAE